ncbi:hypothetical protein MMC14_000915 [Varicellaria rhodocarpa]|nr:hypothetical protein [Varicellaria rhodocarpa]
MATVFEMLGRAKAMFNNLHIASETLNGAILKSVDSVVKSLVTISESAVAIVNDVKVLFEAAKELVCAVREWQHQWAQQWWGANATMAGRTMELAAVLVAGDDIRGGTMATAMAASPNIK